MESVRNQIRTTLKAACNGTTQTRVAAGIGISVGRLNEYMNGDADPRLCALQKIVNFTGKPIILQPETIQ